MERKVLLETLEALHQHLSSADRVDPEAAQLLATVTDDIHRLIDDDQESPPDDSQSLVAKLRSLVLAWEAEHPQVARLIGKTADDLANLGI